MLNWPEVAVATAVTTTISATLIKIFGNGRKCYAKHEKLYGELESFGKELADAGQRGRDNIMIEVEQLRRAREENARNIAVHDSQLKEIRETLHDIKRSQEDIIRMLTGRAGRTHNGNGVEG